MRWQLPHSGGSWGVPARCSPPPRGSRQRPAERDGSRVEKQPRYSGTAARIRRSPPIRRSGSSPAGLRSGLPIAPRVGCAWMMNGSVIRVTSICPAARACGISSRGIATNSTSPAVRPTVLSMTSVVSVPTLAFAATTISLPFHAGELLDRSVFGHHEHEGARRRLIGVSDKPQIGRALRASLNGGDVVHDRYVDVPRLHRRDREAAALNRAGGHGQPSPAKHPSRMAIRRGRCRDRQLPGRNSRKFRTGR